MERYKVVYKYYDAKTILEETYYQCMEEYADVSADNRAEALDQFFESLVQQCRDNGYFDLDYCSEDLTLTAYNEDGSAVFQYEVLALRDTK